MAPPRKKTAKPTTVDDIVYSMNFDASPDSVARLLALTGKFFGLPSDISSRSGLKKVHPKIEAIYPQMEAEFARSKVQQSKCVIVDLYAHLSADVILRNRLFQYGFLSQILSLLFDPVCRNVALDSLVRITQLGGIEVHLTIAKETCGPLLRVLKDYPDDRDSAEMALKILVHTIVPVVSIDGKKMDPNLPRQLPLAEVAQTLIDELHRDPSPSLLDHAAHCIIELSEEVRLTPPMVNLLIAGLRAKDWLFRTRCLSGLVTFVVPYTQRDMRMQNPLQVIQAGNAPAPLRAKMEAFGIERCDSHKAKTSNREFQRVVEGGEFYEGGKTIAELILRTENAFIDAMRPFAGGGRTSDVLLKCANTIREKGVASEANLADILELKYLILRQRYTEAADIARRALKRDPDFAYAYYALSLALVQEGDPADGLRLVKKAAKCTRGPRNLSDFLRLQMLLVGVQWAGELAMRTLNGSAEWAPADEWQVGIAMVKGALDDAELFLEEAPPDHRDARTVMCWAIVLHVMLDENISDNLRELKPYLERLKLSDEFYRWFPDGAPPKTQIRLVAELILMNFSAAKTEWGALIRAFDEDRKDIMAKAPTKEKMERDLAAWVEELDIGGPAGPRCCGHEHGAGHGHGHGHGHAHAHGVAGELKTTEMHRCSWCHNPSAVLRKCGRCSEARYCDASCQKQHWKVHKKKCLAAKNEPAPLD
ncbi:SET and MYND-domain-containing protein 3 [Mycena kentingensis (nom. inval.)]|nr:SET and MYND-domain-containing protein 3 [Mycena kentingensis (nom. inval.)]